jgi:nuclear transport factor 2 (NTF2) superfamily protein
MRNFDYTVNVLVKAYLEDTLAHQFCAACAVGNIISEARSYKISKVGCGFEWVGQRTQWENVFMTSNGIQEFNIEGYQGEARTQIDSTGYAPEELARIEFAFEMADNSDGYYDDYTNETWMFNGLMAVVDVLADIHGIDLKAKEEAKLLFVKI